MDLPFLPMIIAAIEYSEGGVSILVLMDLPFLQNYKTLIKSVYLKVSILVLMDLPFLRKAQNQLRLAGMSFNPCSYGSSVLT